MMKNNRKWILLAGLVVLGAAFLLANFRAASSNTRAESQVITTSMGDALPDVMQRKEKIILAVSGEGPMVNMLQQAIVEELRQAGLGEVVLAPELAQAYPNPVLFVDVGRPGVIWTPFYGTSQFSVKVGYASNGDTTFMTKKPIEYNNVTGPALHMSGEYQVTDRSWGILSRPGYYQVLADYLAHQIVASTKKVYEPKLTYSDGVSPVWTGR